MPDAVVEIVGLEELQRALRASDAQMGRALRSGLQRGAAVVRLEAQRNLKDNRSYITGKLSRSIRPGSVTGTGLGQSIAVGIAPGFGSPSRGHSGPKGAGYNPTGRRNVSDPQDYGPVVERGSGPRRIVARRAKTLAFTVGDETLFRRSVNHPGTRAKPFLVPALTEHVDRINAEMRAAFDVALRAIGRR